jgi:DNA gyrase/topoisomerase IV subunit A
MIAKSEGGGPKTAQGKAVVRWNATRHGISSPKPVVPGLEKQEDWEEHRSGILENLSPVGHLEVTLAERVALLSWRLRRVTRYETESIAVSQEQVEEDIHRMARLLRSLHENPYASTHPEDIRFEAKHYKQVHSALRRFPSLEPDKTLKGADASSVV